MKGMKKEVYRQSMTSQDGWRYVKAIGFPIAILLLSMYTVSVFGLFGSRLIAPCTCVMWGGGVAVALYMSSQRKEVLNQTLIFIGSYLIALLGFRIAIQWVSNVTSEQLMASYNQTITISQSSAIPGYLNNAIWMTSVLTPIGFVGMQAKRVFQFKKRTSKEKAINQYRSIR